MLDQNTDKSFNRTKSNTMDHDRTMLLAVSSDIFTFKAQRKLEVKLNSTALPCSSNGILQMEVDLRTIECAVAFIYHIVKSQIVKSSS